MKIEEIASVSGKPGLYKIVKPTRTGVILESMDKEKKKLVAGPNSRVSILKEISIYTTDVDDTVLLKVVLENIKEQFPEGLEVSNKSSDNELRAFMKKVVKTYDDERVYVSDIKKLVSWYGILTSEAPEILEKEKKEKKKPATKPKKAE